MEKTCLKWRDALSSVPRHRRSMAESSQCRSSVPLMTLRKRTRSSDVVKVLDIDPNIVLINCHESDKGHLYWAMANVMAIFLVFFGCSTWTVSWISEKIIFKWRHFVKFHMVFCLSKWRHICCHMTSLIFVREISVCVWSWDLSISQIWGTIVKLRESLLSKFTTFICAEIFLILKIFGLKF